MSTKVSPLRSKAIVPAGADSTEIVDVFEQVFAIAQPTLTAVEKLRNVRTWLKDYYVPLFDLDSLVCDDDVRERLAVLPEIPVLHEALRIFEDAVRESAPEEWFHCAIGVMLSSMPNATSVGEAYQFAIVDMILRDDEVCEPGCEPGYSPAIVLRAIRQVRRETKFVPTAVELLNAFQGQRKYFRQLVEEVGRMIAVRENAEAAAKVARTKDKIELILARRRAIIAEEDLPF